MLLPEKSHQDTEEHELAERLEATEDALVCRSMQLSIGGSLRRVGHLQHVALVLALGQRRARPGVQGGDVEAQKDARVVLSGGLGRGPRVIAGAGGRRVGAIGEENGLVDGNGLGNARAVARRRRVCEEEAEGERGERVESEWFASRE